MAKIKLILLGDNDKVLQEREARIDVGSGSFTEIEKAVETYQQKEMKEITKRLLSEEQKKFVK